MCYYSVVDINKLAARTVAINNTFKVKFGKQGRAMSLVSEVGELMDAMLEVDGGKEKGTRDAKGKEHVADAIADILYNLFLIANHYDVDIAKEYEKVLADVEKRLSSGEFVKDNE